MDLCGIVVSLNETVAALSYHCFWMLSRKKSACHQLSSTAACKVKMLFGGFGDLVSGSGVLVAYLLIHSFKTFRS